MFVVLRFCVCCCRTRPRAAARTRKYTGQRRVCVCVWGVGCVQSGRSARLEGSSPAFVLSGLPSALREGRRQHSCTSLSRTVGQRLAARMPVCVVVFLRMLTSSNASRLVLHRTGRRLGRLAAGMHSNRVRFGRLAAGMHANSRLVLHQTGFVSGGSPPRRATCRSLAGGLPLRSAIFRSRLRNKLPL